MRIALMLLPWVELFTLIELGIQTSALTAVAYVFVTALIGMAMLQRQGRGMFERLRQSHGGGFLGPQLLLDDMALGFSGLLLIFPGMITDLIAVILAIGPVRRRLMRALSGSELANTGGVHDERSRETIEGEYRRIDDQ
jgi:UPF0716 protein FxsA